MSLVANPWGLRPVKMVGGRPYSGGFNEYKIASGHTGNIFNGSVVYMLDTGYITFVTATGADGTTNAYPAGTTLTGALGVFVGCSYVNQQGQQIWSQYFPTGTTGTITAYVVDDPDVIFQGQGDEASTIAAVGANCRFAAAQSTSTGSTTTGNSTSALDVSTIATTTMPFRIVGFASPATDTYPDILVKFNPGWHSFTNVIGL